MDTILSVLTALGYSPYVGAVYGTPSVPHCVATPLRVTAMYADDARYWEDETVDIDLYLSGDYRSAVNAIVTALEAAGVSIEDRQYITYLPKQKLHNYAISVCLGHAV